MPRDTVELPIHRNAISPAVAEEWNQALADYQEQHPAPGGHSRGSYDRYDDRDYYRRAARTEAAVTSVELGDPDEIVLRHVPRLMGGKVVYLDIPRSRTKSSYQQ